MYIQKNTTEWRHIKQVKQRNKNQKVWIRVFGHKYAFAYIGLAYVGQLYAYTYFEYACTCSKHTYAYTP